MTILEGGADSASAIWTAPLAAGCRWPACHLKYVINSLMLTKSGQNWSWSLILFDSSLNYGLYIYFFFVAFSGPPIWTRNYGTGRSSATPITFGRCSWKSELPTIRPLSGWGLLVSKDVRSLPAALNSFDPSQGLPESTEALQSFRCPAVFRSLYLSWDGRILKDGRENRGLASVKAINIVSQKTLCNHLAFPTCPNCIKLIDNISYSRKVSDLKRALIPAMVIAQHTSKRLKTTYGTMAIWPLSLGSWKNLVKLNIITSTRQTWQTIARCWWSIDLVRCATPKLHGSKVERCLSTWWIQHSRMEGLRGEMLSRACIKGNNLEGLKDPNIFTFIHIPDSNC